MKDQLNYNSSQFITSSYRPKIAFVVQRYGLEINGGAEYLCREVAEHLSKYWDIDVLTTCAIDYITWKNEYPSGQSHINRINVYRFKVDSPRDIDKFNQASEKILGKSHSVEQAVKWMHLQGPYSTTLINFIKSYRDNYDFFFFFTYLYASTYFCLPLVSKKAILLPAAHDEAPIYLSIFNKIFNLPQALVYSTPEEKFFVNRKFKNDNILSDIIGVGVNFPFKIKDCEIEQNYILYVGRIDESKGCKELFNFFIQYKQDNLSSLKLILIGKTVMDIPSHPDIIHLGFVSETEKYDILSKSKVLIMPSKYESLSMVILEAWYCKKPVLVNGICEVLKGQCIRSNAGLWYENFEEFTACLNLLLSNKNLRIKMGKNGSKFVQHNYRWDIIENKYLNLLNNLQAKNV